MLQASFRRSRKPRPARHVALAKRESPGGRRPPRLADPGAPLGSAGVAARRAHRLGPLTKHASPSVRVPVGKGAPRPGPQYASWWAKQSWTTNVAPSTPTAASSITSAPVVMTWALAGGGGTRRTHTQSWHARASRPLASLCSPAEHSARGAGTRGAPRRARLAPASGPRPGLEPVVHSAPRPRQLVRAVSSRLACSHSTNPRRPFTRERARRRASGFMACGNATPCVTPRPVDL
jgi:hypothetical protein